MIQDLVSQEHVPKSPLTQNSQTKSASPKDKKSKDLSKGRWSRIQELKYFLFLYHHKKEFSEDEVRRSQRMCKRMSIYLKSRNSIQCRLHHKRTTDKFGGVQHSIQNFIKHCPKFLEKYQKIKTYFQVLEDRAFCGDNESEDQPIKYGNNQKPTSPACQVQNLVPKKQKEKELKHRIEIQVPSENQGNNENQIWPDMYSYSVYWQPFLIAQSLIYQM